jgi:hypothetical protein
LTIFTLLRRSPPACSFRLQPFAITGKIESLADSPVDFLRAPASWREWRYFRHTRNQAANDAMNNVA